MIDLEDRFIYSLLVANSREQEAYFQLGLSESLFLTRTKEIHWLHQSYQEFKRLPSRQVFEQRFRITLKVCRDHWKVALRAIVDRSMYRQMRDLIEETRKFLDSGRPMEQALLNFRERATKLTNYSTEVMDVSFVRSDLALNRYRDLVELLEDPTKSGSLIDSPWPTLNKLVHFFLPGNMVTIAARTSIGKTWVTAAWCHYLFSRGIRCLFVTKEMPSEDIACRFESLHYRLPYDSFRAGNLPPRLLRRWRRERRNETLGPNLIISGDETVEGIGIGAVAQKIEQYAPAVTFIDGAYLLRPENVNKGASYSDVLRSLSNRSKVLAKALRTVIVLVVQLNREAEKSKQGPDLTHLYGTDAYSQDSDFVFILQGMKGSNRRVLSVQKGRDSAIGDLSLKFQLDPYPDFSEFGASKLDKAASQTTVDFEPLR